MTRPRDSNAADDKRVEFNKATAAGRIPLYERVPKNFETPDDFP